MDRKAALKFIQSRAEKVTWDELAKEIGESAAIIYGWYRRGSVPKWRVPAIEAAAKRLAEKKAA